MASQTTNLNLKKPALDDDALIADINNNMDTLDSTIGAPSSASAVDGANAFAKINSLNSKLATDDFGTVTVAQLETKLQTAFASTTLGTLYYFTAVISTASGIFVAAQYTGQIVKIHSERYYIEMYQAYGFAKIVGKYQSGFAWDSYALNSSLTPQTFTIDYDSSMFGVHNILATKHNKLLHIRGYFSNTSTTSPGIVCVIPLCYPVSTIGSESLPVQCDDGSVQYISFEKSQNNLVIRTPATLTANKTVRLNGLVECSQ